MKNTFAPLAFKPLTFGARSLVFRDPLGWRHDHSPPNGTSARDYVARRSAWRREIAFLEALERNHAGQKLLARHQSVGVVARTGMVATVSRRHVDNLEIVQ
jgi:hypothetical protein